MNRIDIDVREGRGSVGTMTFLGKDWGAFQAACAAGGYRWNKKRGSQSRNEGPVEGLPGVVRDLAAGGFELVVSAAAKEALAKAAATGLTTAEEAALEGVRRREAALQASGSNLRLWRPFQEDGAVFLAARDRALLADEMGIGKTIQALLALPEGAPAVVICPASGVINWARETRRWRPDLRPVAVLRGTQASAIDALESEGITAVGGFLWPRPGEIVIVNWEKEPCQSDVIEKGTGKVLIERTTIGDPAPGTVLIPDELHRAKNRKAKVSMKFATLRDAVFAVGGRVWGMTGTPIYNRPFDLVSILKNLACFDEVFVSWKDFLNRMGGSAAGYGTEFSGIIDPTVAKSLRRVMLRREKKDVMQSMPPVVYKDVEVECSPELERACDVALDRLKESEDDLRALMKQAQALRDDFVLRANAGEWSNDDSNAMAVKMGDILERAHKKVRASISFDEMSRIHALMSKVGYAAALDMIEDLEESNEPVVVFCMHRDPIEALARRKDWGLIIGGQNPIDRQFHIDSFQAGTLKGIAVSIRAGNTAINLNRSANAIFLSFDWSPSENEQAVARLHRGEQKRSVTSIRILPKHPFIERMLELTGWKTQVFADSIRAASVITKMADERQREAREALAVAEREKMVTTDTATNKKVDVRDLLAQIPEGRYALDSVETCSMGTPTHTVFWLLDKPTEGKWAGWAFLKIQHGPEAGRFSTIRPDGLATEACASVLRRLAADPMAAMLRYGREIGECGHCGRALTNEQSRAEGIGPICKAKIQQTVGGVA